MRTFCSNPICILPLLLVFTAAPLIPAGQTPAIRISASSELQEAHLKGKYVYPPAHLLDGNPKTVWVEGVPGAGRGEWVRVEFTQSFPFELIRLRNGFAASERLYFNNNRVRELEIVFTLTDGSKRQNVQELNTNRPDLQDISLPRGVRGSEIRSIDFVITDIVRGKYNDTVLADILFIHKGRAVRFARLGKMIEEAVQKSRAQTMEIARNPRDYFLKMYTGTDRTPVSFYNANTNTEFTFFRNSRGEPDFLTISMYRDDVENFRPAENHSYSLKGTGIYIDGILSYRQISRHLYYQPAGPDALIIDGVKYLRRGDS